MLKTLKENKIVAVIRENDYDTAKNNIDLLIQNGVKIIEITLTTPNALGLIKHFCALKDVIIGAGTVLTLNDAQNCLKNGAKFFVSPHFSEQVSQFSLENKIDYLPGIFSPTEAINAYNKGHKVLKLFPAAILGHKFIADLSKPFPFLNFMPSGGVNLENASSWLTSGAIAISVGSDLLKGSTQKEKIESIKNYLRIVKND
ncbi:bifunctional 4-hydroxy-2-oxoglutarate aldolase/2-dehydro-3-deoxy-phosphogluconate aldolase [Mycoplasmopsis alligatoris]|uniref:2-dehydro-3-deoxyphosphogluconate aldolase/4-hydroxy-2-oxoglutarate aldolase n=1 Tax=Mycoplasmopsis alligatoris A21JP2 TaxID=747682 RepID=D4XVW1_9BACT|nr:bifunctional 4-hydroxy-2-oxoglutarate aldolase/2-dehydro-3-deoxy-phosphogluconate aldolase [Mycoplasmopsis alligatoris]EFF41516.1 2-dehydro-3-deoxyphosphogluconate aldolase/4-hydroxy-2-oxoglutarate aldolase [Mycoplasmopsis alligatoris A21JP2]